MKSCEMTEWQTDEWRLPFFPVLTWKFNEVAQEDRQTDWQTDRWMKTTLIPDLPESSMKLCRMADRQTDRWTKSTLFPVLTWEFNEIVQEDRQTDRWTKTILFPVVTWQFTEVVQDRQTNRQMNQDFYFSSGYLRVHWSCAGQTDKQTDEPRLLFFQWLPESSLKLCRTDRQTDRWTKTSIFPVVTWEFNEVVQDRQTNRQMNQDFYFSSGYLRVQWSCAGQTDKQTDEPRLLFFQWLPESSLKLCRTDRQTDRRTKTSIFPVVTWEFTEVVQDRQTNRQTNQDFYFSSGYLRVQWSCAGGQTDRWSRTVPLPVHWPQTVCWWRWCKTQPACPCTHSTAHLQHNHQGMTVRTARLPGAGNLLGRAGEDLSGLPDQESRYQVIFYWQYISIQAFDFESLWQFLFHGSTIATSVSFYIIKLTDFSVVACDWLASAVKPIRS